MGHRHFLLPFCILVLLNEWIVKSQVPKSDNLNGNKKYPDNRPYLNLNKKFQNGPLLPRSKNIGPNRCHGGFQCCPGWQMNPRTMLCTRATCRGPCGFGICRSPNLCQCLMGGFGSNCPGAGIRRGGCIPSCMNGGHCEGEQCKCKEGYVGRNCEQPICKLHCMNYGRCVGPDRCMCPFGYTGNRCELDHRVGPCFTAIENNMCRRQLIGTKCSQESCCQTVGAAWGIPCQKCTKVFACKRGFYKDPTTKKCKDVNECRGIPNICAMGTCVNTLGSYRCECGIGRVYNPDKFECSDINECSLNKGLCAFGECVNLDGGFQCICNDGYTAVMNGKRCVAKEIISGCYSDYRNGVCRNHRAEVLMTECCCGKINHSYYGDCKICPIKGTAEYRALGCKDDRGVIGAGGDGRGGVGDGGPAVNPFDRKTVPDSLRVSGKGKTDNRNPFVDPLLKRIDPNQDKDDTLRKTSHFESDKSVKNKNREVSEIDRKPSAFDITTDRDGDSNGRNIQNTNSENKRRVTKNNGGNYIDRDNGEDSDVNKNNRKKKVKETEKPLNWDSGKSLGRESEIVNINRRHQSKNGGTSSSDKSNKRYDERDFEKVDDSRGTKRQKSIDFEIYPGKSSDRNPKKAGTHKIGSKQSQGDYDDVSGSKKDIETINGGHDLRTITDLNVNNDKSDTNAPRRPNNNKDGSKAIDNDSKRIGGGSNQGDKEKKSTSLKNSDTDSFNRDITRLNNWDDKTDQQKSVDARNKNRRKSDKRNKEKGSRKESKNKGMSSGPGLYDDLSKKTDSDIQVNSDTDIGNSQRKLKASIDNIENTIIGVWDTVHNYDSNGDRTTDRNYNTDNDRSTTRLHELETTDFEDKRNSNNKKTKSPVSTTGDADGSNRTRIGDKNDRTRERSKTDDRDSSTRTGAWDNVDKINENTNKRKMSDNKDEDMSIRDSEKTSTDSKRGGERKHSIAGDNTRIGRWDKVDRTVSTRIGGERNTKSNDNERLSLHDRDKTSGTNKEKKKDTRNVESGKTRIGLWDRSDKEIDTNEDKKKEKSRNNEFEKSNTENEDGKRRVKDITGSKENTKRGGSERTSIGVWDNISPIGSNSGKKKKTNQNEIERIGGNRDKINNIGSTWDTVDPIKNPIGGDRIVNGKDEDTRVRIGTRTELETNIKWNDKTTQSDRDDRRKISKQDKKVFRTLSVIDRSAKKDRVEILIDPNERKKSLNLHDVDRNNNNNRRRTETDDTDRIRGVTSVTSGFTEEERITIGGGDSKCEQFPYRCRNGYCLPSNGKMKCVCNTGHEKEKDGAGCKDINECNDPIACKNGVCTNTQGSFQCRCNKGYKAGLNGIGCEDVDECLYAAVCPGTTVCVNTVGNYRCECTEGYELNDSKCVDIDECNSIPNLCENGFCSNIPGSYRCICPAGYRFSEKRLVCEAVTVGKCYTKFNGIQCADPLKSELSHMQCCCGMEEMGLRAWGDSCAACPEKGSGKYEEICFNGEGVDEQNDDIDECSINGGEQSGICENGRCKNTEKGYRCICNHGYTIDPLTLRKCIDINECLDDKVCQGGTCNNIKGFFKCECSLGYKYNHETKKCEDINECDKNPCVGGTCENNPGSFLCVCPTGSLLDASGKVCRDQRKGPCFSSTNRDKQCGTVFDHLITKTECCNSIGRAWGTNCEPCNLESNLGCKKGYSRVVSSCKDINECGFENVCKNGGVCTNTRGSFKCVCPKGYSLDASQSTCLDVRRGQCFRKINAFSKCEMPIADRLFQKASCCCTAFSQAWGTPCETCPGKDTAAYTELCPKGSGFQPSGEDINECLVPDVCKNGKCTNTIGSFKCSCNDGYDVDDTGTMCIDVNECDILTDICGQGKCVNTYGSFRCQCQHGYRNDALTETCIDINECKEMNPSPCRNGKCINTPGSFRCDCPTGLKTMGEAIACEDINECLQLGICPNGVCQNFIGGYHCSCKIGYRPSKDMKKCYDVDECLVGNGGCEYACVNTDGSYKCSCQKGYELKADQKSCVDINECRLGTPCGVGNECTNTLGSHVCNCGVGYEPSFDAKACVDIDECRERVSCQNGDCINTAGSFLCHCRKGYKLEKIAMVCIDVDECQILDNGGCHPDARCINNVGSYNCQCKPGYEGDGSSCTDTDECALGLGTCAQNAKCVNTVGSFECDCQPGFAGDGEICLDINECEHDRTLCSPGKCINTVGKYKCDCPNGYSASDKLSSCNDIRNGTCHSKYHNSQCTGTKLCKGPTSKQLCCCSASNHVAWRHTESGSCEACPLIGTEQYKRLCPGGRSSHVDVRNNTILKHKSCDILPFYCRGGECKDDDNMGISCTCLPGMKFNENSLACEDINECLFEGICGYKGKCINRERSYDCVCPDGMVYNEDEAMCQDMRYYNCYFGISNLNQNNKCSVDAGVAMTIAQCCCSLPDSRYGECNECPEFGTVEREALCVGKPSLPSQPTGQPPIINASDTQTPLPKPPSEGPTDRPIISQYFRPDTAIEIIDEDSVITKTNPDGTKELCVTLRETSSNRKTKNKKRKNSGGKKRKNRKRRRKNRKIRRLCSTVKPSLTNFASYESVSLKSLKKAQTTINPRHDIKVCKMLPGICGKGRCIDKMGGYECKCHEGFAQDYENGTKRCVDVDECATSPCIDGICHNIVGAFYCTCPKGRVLDKSDSLRCIDQNECESEGYCENGRCENRPYGLGFDCYCHRGYKKTFDQTSCEDSNECLRDNVCANGTCLNTVGSYKCACARGFQRTFSDICEDIDECREVSDLCTHGICFNTHGSYECSCDEGFQPDAKKHSCKDENECDDATFCENGICQNTIGDATCICKKGFERTRNGRSCQDINECNVDPTLCKHGRCSNLFGSYKCACDPGFTPGRSLQTCQDVDECKISGFCENGRCSNTIGSAICNCNKGFQTKDGRTCEDVNECSRFPNLCRNGRCSNKFGSFECVCDVGYQVDATAHACIDVDECENTDFCRNGICENTVGSAICTCNEGYKLSRDNTCEDVNECETDNPPCQFGGQCENIPGSYLCRCNDGFVTDRLAQHCIDARQSVCFTHLDPSDNRCAKPNGLSLTKSTCCCSMNAGWGDPCELCPKKESKEFKYYCPNGVGLEKNNTDIDECKTNLVKCTNGECLNTDGSYVCKCKKGYKLNSINRNECIDIDECKDGSHHCGTGKCTNLIGSYKCECAKGFRIAIGSQGCLDINECKEQKDLCAFRCQNVPGTYKCICPRGFEVAKDGKHCKDVDECKQAKFICPYKCTNIVGGYRCACPSGYRRYKDGQCREINECTQDVNLCQPGGVCQNIEGGYRCDCTAPYMRSNDGKYCQDKRMGYCYADVTNGLCENPIRKIPKRSQQDCCCSSSGDAWGPNCRLCPKLYSDHGKSLCGDYQNKSRNECEYIVGACKNGKCMDTADTFRCMCDKGFKLSMDGKKCSDIDECKEVKNNCHGSCKNTKGSYECICQKGYVFYKKQMKCVDRDECKTGNHKCAHHCNNTIGGYQCTCMDGYRKISNGLCIDINECNGDTSLCGAALCRNVRGSYQCVCARGFIFDKEKKKCQYTPNIGSGGVGGGVGLGGGVPPSGGGCNNPQGGCGCPPGFFPYFNPFGISQCVDVNECRQNMCGQTTCINTIGSFRCACPSGYNYEQGTCKDVNECVNSPCSYGCNNNRGGFSCKCPQGYNSVGGGHCVATHGVTCFKCDTSDIPEEGLPLSPDNNSGGHTNAVGDMSVPLVDRKEETSLPSSVPAYSQGSNPFNPKLGNKAGNIGFVKSNLGLISQNKDPSNSRFLRNVNGLQKKNEDEFTSVGINPESAFSDATGNSDLFGVKKNREEIKDTSLDIPIGGDGLYPSSGIGLDPGSPIGGMNFNKDAFNTDSTTDTSNYPSFHPRDISPINDPFGTPSNLKPKSRFAGNRQNYQTFRAKMPEFKSRKRRSIKKPSKPIYVKVSRRESRKNETLLRIATLLKDMAGHMDYEIVNGNKTLFRFSKSDHDGVTYLYSTEQLHFGRYVLSIRGGVRQNGGHIEEKLKNIYSDARDLYLKVLVHVA